MRCDRFSETRAGSPRSRSVAYPSFRMRSVAAYTITLKCRGLDRGPLKAAGVTPMGDRVKAL